MHLSQAGTRERLAARNPVAPPVDHLIRRERTYVHAYAWLASFVSRFLRVGASHDPPSYFLLASSPRCPRFAVSASRCSLAHSLAVARKSTRDFHRWRARTRETVGIRRLLASIRRGGEKQVIAGQDRSRTKHRQIDSLLVTSGLL